MIVASGHERSRERIKREVGYLKWVCKSYEWQIRIRRRKVLEAGVAKGDGVVEEAEEEEEGDELEDDEGMDEEEGGSRQPWSERDL